MPVQIEAAERNDRALELIVGEGYRIKIGAGFCATTLRRLLEVLGSCYRMLGFGSATRVYVAIGATDMRKGFEGLFGIVRDRLMIDPLSGHVFVFCNSSWRVSGEASGRGY
jgi:IS66 Orf2 like protein